MNKEAFNRDLEAGEQGEEIILAMVRKKHPLAHKVAGMFKPYDIYIPEIGKSIEVKTDSKSHETGNVFIETVYNYKPSGVLTTKADKWAYITKEVIIYIPPEQIKCCIIFNELRAFEFQRNQNSEQKKGFIISREIFDAYAEKIKVR